MAPKMLRPKDIRDNLENFNSVTRDAIEHLVSIRGGDMVIPDLEKELAKWSTECKELFVRDHLTEDNLARGCKAPTRDNFLLEYEPAFKIFLTTVERK